MKTLANYEFVVVLGATDRDITAVVTLLAATMKRVGLMGAALKLFGKAILCSYLSSSLAVFERRAQVFQKP